MPAISDGRTFTSYLSAGQAENALQRRFGVSSETQYRQYLQHNSALVLRELRQLQVVVAPPQVRRT
jgi:hypothetical protein